MHLSGIEGCSPRRLPRLPGADVAAMRCRLASVTLQGSGGKGGDAQGGYIGATTYGAINAGGGGSNGISTSMLLMLLAVGGAVWFFFFRKRKK